jgi:hypothetical protein
VREIRRGQLTQEERGGAGQGGTRGDVPRRRRDDGAEGSARDGGVPVQGGSGGCRRPRGGGVVLRPGMEERGCLVADGAVGAGD